MTATALVMLGIAMAATGAEPTAPLGRLVHCSLARVPLHHQPLATEAVATFVVERYERLRRVRERWELIRGARSRLESKFEWRLIWPRVVYKWVSEWA